MNIYFISQVLLLSLIAAVAGSAADTAPNNVHTPEQIWKMGGGDINANTAGFFSNDRAPAGLPWGSDASGIRIALTHADPAEVKMQKDSVLLPIAVYIQNPGSAWVLLGDYGAYQGVDFYWKNDSGQMVRIASPQELAAGPITLGGTWQPLPPNRTYRYLLMVPPEIFKAAKGQLFIGVEVKRAQAPGWDVVYSNAMSLP